MNDGVAGRPASSQPLDRLCAVAAQVLNCRVAAVSLHRAGVSRMIASSGVDGRFRSQSWDFQETTPFDLDAAIAISDSSGSAVARFKTAYLGLERAGFFYRRMIERREDYALSLIVADPQVRALPTAEELRLLDRLRKLIATAVREFSPLLTDPAADVTAPVSLREATAGIAASPRCEALIDARQNVVAISEPMSRLLGLSVDFIEGSGLRELPLPMSDALFHTFRHALETKISLPDFEVVTRAPEGGRRTWQVSAAPFSPTDTPDYFLHLSVVDTTRLGLGERRLAPALAHRAQAAPQEPSFAFLKETLVARRTIRARKDVHYLTLYAWRAAIREWQIAALKALKQALPPDMATGIAREMAKELNALVGLTAFRGVVPVPCGRSSADNCLSLELARALALEMDAPVIQALASKPQKGGSHPKSNLRRPPMELVRPVGFPVLLVDDVATSGAHIEEAVKLLRPQAGSVLAVAWISGDVK